jgi:hypothetical protein
MATYSYTFQNTYPFIPSKQSTGSRHGTHYADGVRIGAIYPSQDVINESSTNGQYGSCLNGEIGAQALLDPEPFNSMVYQGGNKILTGDYGWPTNTNLWTFIATSQSINQNVGINIYNVLGYSVLQLDVPRTIDMFFNNNSTVLTNQVATIYTYGFDRWLRPMVEVKTANLFNTVSPSSTITIYGTKAFAYYLGTIWSFTGTNAVLGSIVNILLGNYIGLPWYCPAPCYVETIAIRNGSTPSFLTPSSVIPAAPYDTTWGTVPPTGNLATTAPILPYSGDVCGLVNLTGQFPSGTNTQSMVTVSQYVPGLIYPPDNPLADLPVTQNQSNISGGPFANGPAPYPDMWLSSIYGFPQYTETFPAAFPSTNSF